MIIYQFNAIIILVGGNIWLKKSPECSGDFVYLIFKWRGSPSTINGVSSPIIGATKAKYFDDAAGSFDVKLTAEDIAYLEEPYVPHRIVGAL